MKPLLIMMIIYYKKKITYYYIIPLNTLYNFEFNFFLFDKLFFYL